MNQRQILWAIHCGRPCLVKHFLNIIIFVTLKLKCSTTTVVVLDYVSDMSQTGRNRLRICLRYVSDKSQTNPLNGVWLISIDVVKVSRLDLSRDQNFGFGLGLVNLASKNLLSNAKSLLFISISWLYHCKFLFARTFCQSVTAFWYPHGQ